MNHWNLTKRELETKLPPDFSNLDILDTKANFDPFHAEERPEKVAQMLYFSIRNLRRAQVVD